MNQNALLRSSWLGCRLQCVASLFRILNQDIYVFTEIHIWVTAIRALSCMSVVQCDTVCCAVLQYIAHTCINSFLDKSSFLKSELRYMCVQVYLYVYLYMQWNAGFLCICLYIFINTYKSELFVCSKTRTSSAQNYTCT